MVLFDHLVLTPYIRSCVSVHVLLNIAAGTFVSLAIADEILLQMLNL